MTAKDLYLQSIDHCRMFQPIAEELGIEPDFWRHPDGEMVVKIYTLMNNIASLTGEPKRQATVELVCLLKEENLLCNE